MNGTHTYTNLMLSYVYMYAFKTLQGCNAYNLIIILLLYLHTNKDTYNDGESTTKEIVGLPIRKLEFIVYSRLEFGAGHRQLC